MVKRAEILGVEFDQLDETGLVEHVLGRLEDGFGGWMVTPNLHILRQATLDPETAHLVRSASLVVMDGAPVEWAGRVSRHATVPRAPGSTVFWSLCRAAAEAGRPVLLMGGREGAAEAAADVLRARYPGIDVAVHFPPFGFEADPEQRRRIEQAVRTCAGGLVFVGLGCPKQERLMAELSPKFPNTWFFGVGAAIDFASGQMHRAPEWMQKSGLEWSHRLMSEPRRLARRYLLEDVPFAARLMGWALAQRAHSGADARRRQPAPAADSGVPAIDLDQTLTRAAQDAASGAAPTAKRGYRQVLASATAAPEQRALALDGLVDRLWRDGNYAECVDLLESRLDLPFVNDVEHIATQAKHVYALNESGNHDAARAGAEYYLFLAESGGAAASAEVTRLRTTLAGILLAQGDIIAAELQVSLAMASADRLGDPRAQGWALWNAALISGADGRPDEAADLARSARARLQEAGDELAAARAALVELKVTLDGGLPRPRPEDCHALLDVLEAHGSASHLGLAHALVARLHLENGEAQRALGQIQMALALIGDANSSDTQYALGIKADILAALGQAPTGPRPVVAADPAAGPSRAADARPAQAVLHTVGAAPTPRALVEFDWVQPAGRRPLDRGGSGGRGGT